jgi:glutathione S-transferase
LSNKTFIAGNRLTVADVAVFAIVHAYTVSLNKHTDKGGEFIHVVFVEKLEGHHLSQRFALV